MVSLVGPFLPGFMQDEEAPGFFYGPQCHAKGITGYGNPSAGVVLVGIAPGGDEMVGKKPFVGISGRLANATLKAAGWSRERCYATNCICWWNDAPNEGELGACAQRFWSELYTLRPKLVVALGAIPVSRFTSIPLSKVRGRPFKFTITDPTSGNTHDTIVLPTYHPAAIFHGSIGLIHDIWRDFNKIAWHIEHGFPLEPVLHVVTSEFQAKTVLQFLDQVSGIISVDVETNSPSADEIDVFKDDLLCLALGRMTYNWTERAEQAESYIIPREFLTSDVIDTWKKMGNNRATRWLGHNVAFDMQVLKKNLDLDLEISEDTMLQSYSVDERAGQHGLKKLAQEYCGAGFYDEAMGPYRKGGMDKAPKAVLYKYNGLDAAYTSYLHYRLTERQIQEDVEAPYREMLIPAANAFREIQYRGIAIDHKELLDIKLAWLPKWLEQDDLLVRTAQEAGFPGDINLNSPKQLSHLLYDILHLPMQKVKGVASRTTKADVLEILGAEFPEIPFMQELMRYRKLDHMLSTYVNGVEDDIKNDGRIHPTAMIHGTLTGRLAYHDPPMQTIPNHSMEGKEENHEFLRVRNLFCATNDDYIIAEADHAQIELWMAYFESGDEVMGEDLRSDDFHARAASGMFRRDRALITSLDRFNSKFVTYGTMYGRGDGDIAREIKCSKAFAQNLVQGFFTRYHIYHQWWLETQQRILTDGELVSRTGRKRRFRMTMPGADRASAFRQAVNFPLQSAASDYTLWSLIKLHWLLKEFDSYVLWGCHDAIIFEINRRYLSEVKALVFEVMEAPKIGLPSVPITFKTGTSLGRCA